MNANIYKTNNCRYRWKNIFSKAVALLLAVVVFATSIGLEDVAAFYGTDGNGNWVSQNKATITIKLYNASGALIDTKTATPTPDGIMNP